MSDPRRILSAFVLLAASAHAQRVITTIAGADWLFPGDGRPAINAPLSGAIYGLDIAADSKGNYFIADGDNFMVMRVGPDGIIHVVAGNGINFSSGDGAFAINACLSAPTAITSTSPRPPIASARSRPRVSSPPLQVPETPVSQAIAVQPPVRNSTRSTVSPWMRRAISTSPTPAITASAK